MDMISSRGEVRMEENSAKGTASSSSIIVIPRFIWSWGLEMRRR